MPKPLPPSAATLPELGETNPAARQVICSALEFTNNASAVRAGTMSEDEFVARYRAQGDEFASAAANVYDLLVDASEGDLIAASQDLACLG